MFGIMFSAGLLGGGLNYLLSPKEPDNGGEVWKSIVGGLVASFMVPLFLNMISSNLVDSIRGSTSNPGDPSKLFVFAGFCLVAAVSSKAFISTLSDRILSEAKAARKELKQIKTEVGPIIAKETEEETQETELRADTQKAKLNLSDNQQKVLKALVTGRFTLRTRTGISNDAQVLKDDVAKTLDELAAKGLARSVRVLVQGQPKTRWYATEQGRMLIS
jgi:transcriptional regulator of acetoin/glycerol metabolism